MDAINTRERISGSIDSIPGDFSDALHHRSRSRLLAGSECGRTGAIFRSFWMGGYEGADHRNSHGVPLDMAGVTGHTGRADDDYALLADFGIRTVRESAGWRLIERNGEFDFSVLEARLDAARRHGIQVAWTLCHYGWPDDVDVFDDQWIDRFERYARAASKFIADRSDVIPLFTPINEISFLSWAVCDTCLIHPYRAGRLGDGYGVKRRLVRGAIAAAEAIWESLPGAHILSVDPMIHIIPPADRPDLVEHAARERSFQFQAWDLLAGIAEPELGGSSRHLGVVGINYYHDNQWEIGSNERLHWHMGDSRRVPLRSLMHEAAARYGAPLAIAETSHVGAGRGLWIDEVAQDVAVAIADGLAIHGICLYPILDRPDWERDGHWHNSGLWDVGPAENGMPRLLCEPYARDLRDAQRRIQAAMDEAVPRPLQWPVADREPELDGVDAAHPAFFNNPQSQPGSMNWA